MEERVHEVVDDLTTSPSSLIRWGPVFAGAVYDRTESYASVLWTLFAVLSLATFLNILLIKPWRQRMVDLRGQAMASVH